MYSDDSVQLWFGASLQSEVELSSVRDNLLHYWLYLVNLYGVDDEVLTLVVVFLLRLLEAACRFLDAVVENVWEPQQHRRSDIAQCQLVHDLSEVYLGVVLAW